VRLAGRGAPRRCSSRAGLNRPLLAHHCWAEQTSAGRRSKRPSRAWRCQPTATCVAPPCAHKPCDIIIIALTTIPPPLSLAQKGGGCRAGRGNGDTRGKAAEQDCGAARARAAGALRRRDDPPLATAVHTRIASVWLPRRILHPVLNPVATPQRFAPPGMCDECGGWRRRRRRRAWAWV
jgi:hypothetical protein